MSLIKLKKKKGSGARLPYGVRSGLSQWYHWKFYPENPERFSAANGTIGANVTIGENVGTNGTNDNPNGTIGKPKCVDSNIMINTSNLFFYTGVLERAREASPFVRTNDHRLG